MTSIVDTSVKHFHSGMVNAPVLTGAVGSLIALLDALLKDGFDTKSVTSLTVAGGVATVNWSGTHSATADAVVALSGITGPLASLNGEQRVATKPGTTSLTFLTDQADGTATGTITMKMAPLGFTKPFSGTNLAAYKSSDVTSNGFLLRVDDSAVQTVDVRGYESMSDINTGVGAFPTAAQFGTPRWAKATASTGAVPWWFVGDSKFFMISSRPGVPTVSNYYVGVVRGFGEAIPYRPAGDPFLSILGCSSTTTVLNQFDGDYSVSAASSIFTPRSFTGVGSSVFNFASPVYGGSTTLSGISATLGAFPNPVDGALYFAKRLIFPSGQSYPRGEIPGYYHIPQSGVRNFFAAGDKVAGTGLLAGRTMMIVPANPSAAFNQIDSDSVTALAAFDITGPWR